MRLIGNMHCTEKEKDIKKDCSTDQSKLQPKKNYFETIIAPGEDIDNNEVFDMKTGKTVRELI